VKTTRANWSQAYSDMVNRNIGFTSLEDQERLRQAKVTVFGMGGIGGTAFEILVRTGIGRFTIVDRDVFDATNLNRQVFATHQTLGRLKTEVAAEWARAINAEVEIATFEHVNEESIAAILDGADAAVLGIDSLAPCIIASRRCRELAIPLVEGWAIPYGNVRVFTRDTPTLEDTYELPTSGRRVADVSDKEMQRLGLAVFGQLAQIEGIRGFYSDDVVEEIRKGRIVSFAPVVRLTAVLLALETTKVLLRQGRLAVAPYFSLYDPFFHRIPKLPGQTESTRQRGASDQLSTHSG